MISILLAVYNGEKYIKESIESVLNQTFKDWELLVGFNGTTDNSKEILAKYNDSRIRVFDYGDDKGKAKTLNKLIKEAKYDWIAIQDDDDIWLPKKLERQIKYTIAYDVIGTQIVYMDENSKVNGEGPKLTQDDENIRYRSLMGDNQIANTSAIVRKRCINEIDGWSEAVDGIEDFDLWLKIMRISRTNKFINLPSVEVFHRLHNKSNFNTNKYDLNKIL